jgi:hypothetical protein
MWKRVLYGGIFGLVCIGLLMVFLFQRLDKGAPLEVFQAVPDDAILLIEHLDYGFFSESYLPQNRVWVDFVNTTGHTDLDSVLHQWIFTIDNADLIRDVLLKEGLSISIHLQGKDQLVPLFYIPYSDHYDGHDFEQVVLELAGEGAALDERKYEAETLYQVSGYTMCCLSGICLFSPSSLLVEHSVRTIHSGTGLNDDEELKQVKATAGKYVHANVYLNYSRVHQLMLPLIKEQKWVLLNNFSRLASWGELDLDFKEDAVILNGMTRSQSEQPRFLDAWRGQAPVKMELQEMMPSGTSSFLHLGISDRELFMERLEDYLERSGSLEPLKGDRERLTQRYDIDPLGDLFRIMDDEMAWFSMEGEMAGPDQEILMVETRSHSETEEVVLQWIAQYASVQDEDIESYRSVYRLDDQTSFPVYRLPESLYEGSMAGRLFNLHFTVFEGCLLFGPSLDAISRVIYQNILHKTFVTDPFFKETSAYRSNRSNLTVYIRPFTYLEKRKDLFNEPVWEKIKTMELFLRRIPGVMIQFSAEDPLLYHSLSFKYTSQIKEKALTVWESLMDSSVLIKPALVVNHNTREKEIFVQDASNKVYLINSTGRILWEQMLDGPIMGEVMQVDYYNNGKLQMLFNTRERMHLLDRNGNHVERYPIVLRAEATSGLALFDYDQDREYRIFVPGEDRKIYVYDLGGNLVPGWRFGKTESAVTSPPRHFRVDDRDYIVFFDRNRPYILNRRGRERVKPSEMFAFSNGNPIILDMNIREDKPRLISTDTAGSVRCIYLDGSVATLLDQSLDPGHFFRMQDMDMDGIPEFIIAQGDELTIRHQDGKRLFSYRVRDQISEMPDIYKFSSSDIKIGLTDQSRNRIYLINSDGTLYEGFPLEGSSRFTIGYFAGSDSRFNLLVGSTNNFLYNYSIE